MKIISIVNQKGGVGKTTTTVNLAAGLGLLRRKVLVIDMDPEAHMTFSMGIEADSLDKTIYDVMFNEVPVGDVILVNGSMHIVPANQGLIEMEIEIQRRLRDHERALLSGATAEPFSPEKYLIRGMRDIWTMEYEYVLIDCPPSLGYPTANALTASAEVIVPVETQFASLRGLSHITSNVDAIREISNPHLHVGGILCTRYDGRRNMDREVVSYLREEFGQLVFKAVIRDNVALSEASSLGKTIFDYRAGSHGAEDYLKLAQEIAKG
jgi:chromosome partitioning protein